MSVDASTAAVEAVTFPPLPDLTTALPAIPGGWSTVTYEISQRQFHLVLPKSPDDFLDDPHVNEWHRQDGYMPYWSYLWPTSLEMGELLLARKWPMQTTALEIGSGIGLTGVIALAAGLDVVLSDYDPLSLQLAAFNARLNGFSDVRTWQLDWRSPPDEPKFPVILGCDVIYERRSHEPILGLLIRLLAPGGEVWLADPGRVTANLFITDARASGWDVTCETLTRKPYPDRPEGVTNIWILRRGVE